MKQFLRLLVLIISLANGAGAQSPADSVIKTADSSLLQADSIPVPDSVATTPVELKWSKRPLTDTGWTLNPPGQFPVQTIQWQILAHHPYFGFHFEPGKGSRQIPLSQGKPHQAHGKEWLFYSLLLLIILFALLRRTFPKYFNDLFRLFFRTTLKERQISEQLMQSPVPSILLNGFFTISAGFYCSFLLEYFRLNPAGDFWILLLYCIGGLAGAYFVKFIGLKISGWIFNMKGAADSYIFIIFIINKMIGILLLPFLLILAFSSGQLYMMGLTLSWCLVGVLLVYRLFLTYTVVRNQVKVSPFHFFLYFLAFEIAPLLLVYKALLVYFS